MVEELKYLGTNLMNQNSIQEGFKSRLTYRMLAIIGAQSLVFQFAVHKYED